MLSYYSKDTPCVCGCSVCGCVCVCVCVCVWVCVGVHVFACVCEAILTGIQYKLYKDIHTVTNSRPQLLNLIIKMYWGYIHMALRWVSKPRISFWIPEHPPSPPTPSHLMYRYMHMISDYPLTCHMYMYIHCTCTDTATSWMLVYIYSNSFLKNSSPTHS